MQTYEQELQQVKSFLLEHDDYLVVSHVQPDGDAVSSTLAVGWLLSCLGKKFTMINEGTSRGVCNCYGMRRTLLTVRTTAGSKIFARYLC